MIVASGCRCSSGMRTERWPRLSFTVGRHEQRADWRQLGRGRSADGQATARGAQQHLPRRQIGLLPAELLVLPVHTAMLQRVHGIRVALVCAAMFRGMLERAPSPDHDQQRGQRVRDAR